MKDVLKAFNKRYGKGTLEHHSIHDPVKSNVPVYTIDEVKDQFGTDYSALF